MANPTVTVDVSSVEAQRGTKVILDQFGRIIRTVKQVDQATEKSFKKVGQQMRRVAQQSKQSANSINGMSARLRNLGSSAIFAIGPLSGVGARIVAFTAIATRSTFAVAALLATVAGLTIAVFKLTKRMLEVSIATERVINSLKVSTGTAGRARAEFRFVALEAARLGVNLEVSVRQFAQLSAAAKGTTLQGEAVRKIFTAVAQAATVLQLSTDATQGAFRAIQQIMSKGTVQAEELRGQLGERLPGAFQIAARAMGKTTAELGKMLEQGELLSEEFLPLFAEELMRAFGPGVEDAVQSLTAETNKLETALFGVFQELNRITKASVIWKFIVQQTRLFTEDIKTLLSDPTVEDIIRNRADVIQGRLGVLRNRARLFGEQATQFARPGQQPVPKTTGRIVPGARREIQGVEVRALQPPGLAKDMIELVSLEKELNKLKERAIELGFTLGMTAARRKSFVEDLSKAETIQQDKARRELIKQDKFEIKLMETLRRKPATIKQITEAQKLNNREARIAILTIQAENRLIKRGIELTADRTTEIRKLTVAIEAQEEALRRTRTGLAQLARGTSDFDTASAAAKRGVLSLEDSLVDLITRAESAGDAFKVFARTVIEEIARMVVAAQITKPLAGILNTIIGSVLGAAVGGVGVDAGAIEGSANPIPPLSGGTQHGGSFRVGGIGGPDSRLVQLAVSPGERIDVLSPAQQSEGGGTVIQNFDFRGASLEAVALLQQKTEEIKAETLAAVMSSGLRGGSIARLPKV